MPRAAKGGSTTAGHNQRRDPSMADQDDVLHLIDDFRSSSGGIDRAPMEGRG